MNYIQPIQPGFSTHIYEKLYRIQYPVQDVWEILLRQSTFSDTQIWPFRVEFEGPRNVYMETGMDNIHHGPFMLFAGVVTEIRDSVYRDLHYYSGSYFLSLRWIRPARLEFELAENSGVTEIKLRLTSYTKPWIRSFWNFALKIFWSNFGSWLNRYIGKETKRFQVAQANSVELR